VQAALYIQIKNRKAITFGFPLHNWLKDQFPYMLLLDADNFSDDLVIDQELKMLKPTQSCLLMIDAEPEAKPGKSIRLIEILLRDRDRQLTVHLKGRNEYIEKMLKLSKVAYHKNLAEEELKKTLKSGEA